MAYNYKPYVGPGYPGDLNRNRLLETHEVIIQRQREDAAAAHARAMQALADRYRNEGLRIRLSKINGVTKGDTLKVLARPYIFQCPPLEEFQVPRSRAFGKYTNYEGSEYLSRGGKALIPLTFRTLAVEWGSFTVQRYYDVEELIHRLERIVDAGWPFKFLATHAFGKRPELYMDAVLESVTKAENAGEVDARYLDLTFSQWREPAVAVKGRGGGGKWPKYATIRKDGSAYMEKGTGPTATIKPRVGSQAAKQATLASLARDAYGKTSLWRHIAAAQKPPIRNWGAHTPLIKAARFKKAGGRVKIPAPPPKQKKKK